MAIHTLDWQQAPPEICHGGAVTIGNFDGVHRGHAALVGETSRLAHEVSGPSVVFTFDPHPLQLLRPEQFLPLLTTLEDRARLLIELGADEVIVQRTSHEMLHLTAEQFFHRVLREGLHARALAEGEDFHFGHRRAGDVQLLRSLCKEIGVQLAVLLPVAMEGKVVSSSRVREALARGDVTMASKLLDRPYRLHGRVSTGQKRGKTLGFPTANLDPVRNFVPADGVYAVRVLHDERSWAGAANIGPNPTFGENARKVEVHLIDFSGDLYGQDLTVDFQSRMRDTRPFAGIKELREQLHRDVEQARMLVVF
jgi:riboflavin kinase/FMN adenylyltransferase